jgi:hypothetical protein
MTKLEKGFLYLLSHPSDLNLFKIGMTTREPIERLKEHNSRFDQATGKVVKETGKLWNLEKFIEVEDVYSAEYVFWHRPPYPRSTEIPRTRSNELIDVSALGIKWVKDGFEAVSKSAERFPKRPKPIPKRGSAWVESQLKGTGIQPLKTCGNGTTRVWFSCEKGHLFKIGGYILVGGYGLSRVVSCPACHPENFTKTEHDRFIEYGSA